jgi:hypothetical protein
MDDVKDASEFPDQKREGSGRMSGGDRRDALQAEMFFLEFVGKFSPILPRIETVCGLRVTIHIAKRHD